ncbi:FHA domain-containing protein [Roseateles sp. DAIF2]|uniref:FHA domain-containing protein n=1 Tax=Roseateles sp. DAIF2 TaxID=2714952 RepID=UPI0018A2C6D3|nr:FHA domain-containing protein [Roseateles sp. DAIF2]QPF75354.1 FHA domain-containing protein [Roseateles sp. DAIF2]
MEGSTAAVIEVLGRDGHVRTVHRIQDWPVSIGRSPACDLVLDDAHLAGAHARLELDEAGQPRLNLLESRNGGWLGRQRLAAGAAVALGAGAAFQLGATQLRLRRASDPLAPERPLLSAALAPRLPLLLAVLGLWLALLWGDQWSALNPGSAWVDYAGAVLVPLGLLLIWAAVWALVTQLFQHRFPFAIHLWRALLGVAALYLLSFALPLLAYAFSARWLLTLDGLLFPVGLALLLWWHSALVWPRARRALAWAFGGLLIGSMALLVAKRQEQQYWFGPPYLATLPPPALRLAGPKPPEALIESLRPLQDELARQADKDGESGGADEE